MVLWLNGAFYDETEAFVPANTAGILLGWGVFSTVGVWHGRAFALNRHLLRLRRNAEALDIEIPFDDSVLIEATTQVLARCGIETGTARFTVTRRGDKRWNHAGSSDFSILARFSYGLKVNDLRLILSPFRLDARRALAGVKSTSYMEHQLAASQALRQRYDEALLCNQNGAICEGALSNIFWARGSELFTPSLQCGCLPGIAREIMLEAAASLGFTIHEGVFSLPEISAADEIFITSASSGPRGVTVLQIENEAQNFPTPGPVTQSLQHWWQQNTLTL